MSLSRDFHLGLLLSGEKDEATLGWISRVRAGALYQDTEFPSALVYTTVRQIGKAVSGIK